MVRLVTLAFLLCVAALPARLDAETFLLAGGGRIEGRLMNPAETPRENFIIRMAIGGTITLTKAQVEKVVTKSPAEIEYDGLLAHLTADAEAHWKLAEWCRKQDGMEKQREFHMQKVLDFEPEHEGARRGLGYSQIEGKWVKPDEHMEAMGFVRFEGKWRTPQEVELEKGKDDRDQQAKDWRKKIVMWTKWLRDRNAAKGMENLKAIRDPLAAIALGELLKTEEDVSTRKLYVDILSRLPPGAGSGPLIDAALTDSDDQIRDLAMRTLGQWGPPIPTPVLVRALAKSDSNQMINRAGLTLAAVRDPEAILPLIDALVTKHKEVQKTGGGPGAIGASFGSGGSGLSAGGSGTKVTIRELSNEGVLSALLALSGGENFRFDKAAWRQWYGQQNGPKNKKVNLRRDD